MTYVLLTVVEDDGRVITQAFDELTHIVEPYGDPWGHDTITRVEGINPRSVLVQEPSIDEAMASILAHTAKRAYEAERELEQEKRNHLHTFHMVRERQAEIWEEGFWAKRIQPANPYKDHDEEDE